MQENLSIYKQKTPKVKRLYYSIPIGTGLFALATSILMIMIDLS